MNKIRKKKLVKVSFHTQVLTSLKYVEKTLLLGVMQIQHLNFCVVFPLHDFTSGVKNPLKLLILLFLF